MENIFEIPREQALQKLTQLEKTAKLAAYIKKHHPEYYLGDGTVASFSLAKRLGLLGVDDFHLAESFRYICLQTNREF